MEWPKQYLIEAYLTIQSELLYGEQSRLQKEIDNWRETAAFLMCQGIERSITLTGCRQLPAEPQIIELEYGNGQVRILLPAEKNHLIEYEGQFGSWRCLLSSDLQLIGQLQPIISPAEGAAE